MVGVISTSLVFVSVYLRTADEDEEDEEDGGGGGWRQQQACGTGPQHRPEVVSVERVSGGFLQASVQTRV